MSLRSKPRSVGIRKSGKISGRVTATNRKVRRQARRTDHKPAALATIAEFSVEQSTEAAQDAELVAVDAIRQGSPLLNANSKALKAILSGASPDDAKRLKNALAKASPASERPKTSDELASDWRKGGYPYKSRMLRRDYEQQKFFLQTELLKLQAWMKENRQRLILLFEGRDAAGKGGAIKRFMEHLNPRGARVVALEKPSDVERGQWYFQRYVEYLPTAGEMSIAN